jgi:hypothetical protein
MKQNNLTDFSMSNMSLIDWLHECGHAALELAALTSSGFVHAVLHVVIYGTPAILFISLIWIAFALRARVNARRAPRGGLDEDLHCAYAVGLTDGIFKLILRRTRLRQAV